MSLHTCISYQPYILFQLGLSPLELAVSWRYTKTLQILLGEQHGQFKLSPDTAKKCFYNACSKGDYEIAEIILANYGIDLNAQDIFVHICGNY